MLLLDFIDEKSLKKEEYHGRFYLSCNNKNSYDFLTFNQEAHA